MNKKNAEKIARLIENKLVKNAREYEELRMTNNYLVSSYGLRATDAERTKNFAKQDRLHEANLKLIAKQQQIMKGMESL